MNDDLDTQIAPSTAKKLYTLEEVAEILRVDAATVRRWAKLRRIKVIRLPQSRDGGRTVLRISHQTLDQLLLDQFLPDDGTTDATAWDSPVMRITENYDIQ